MEFIDNYNPPLPIMKEYENENNSFGEEEALEELARYIKGTYFTHYAKGSIQSTEFIFDAGHGEGFCLGNIIKYAQRYGKKNGENVDDLYKLCHYSIMLLGEKLKDKPDNYDWQ